MGFGIKELIVILIIVALLFGTKKLKNIGSDLGGAIKGFKKSMGDDDDSKDISDDITEPLEPPAPLKPVDSSDKAKDNNKAE